MSDHPFDSLARTLAAGASRRGVLRALGGAVLGSLVAAPARVVLADNSACAHFCAAVFGADTPAAGQCTSEAAHHKGLCYTCGPASSGGIKPICCPKNGAGQCSSYSTATCCKSPQTCGGGGTAGVCGCTPTTCPNGVCGQISNGCGGMLTCTCGPGQICSNGHCVSATTTTPPPCQNSGGRCTTSGDCCAGLSCTSDAVCCYGFVVSCNTAQGPVCCRGNQLCQSGTCCFGLGAPCAPDFGDYCCPGLVCTNGTCVAAV